MDKSIFEINETIIDHLVTLESFILRLTEQYTCQNMSEYTEEKYDFISVKADLTLFLFPKALETIESVQDWVKQPGNIDEEIRRNFEKVCCGSQQYTQNPVLYSKEYRTLLEKSSKFNNAIFEHFISSVFMHGWFNPAREQPYYLEAIYAPVFSSIIKALGRTNLHKTSPEELITFLVNNIFLCSYVSFPEYQKKKQKRMEKEKKKEVEKENEKQEDDKPEEEKQESNIAKQVNPDEIFIINLYKLYTMLCQSVNFHPMDSDWFTPIPIDDKRILFLFPSYAYTFFCVITNLSYNLLIEQILKDCKNEKTITENYIYDKGKIYYASLNSNTDKSNIDTKIHTEFAKRRETVIKILQNAIWKTNNKEDLSNPNARIATYKKNYKSISYKEYIDRQKDASATFYKTPSDISENIKSTLKNQPGAFIVKENEIFDIFISAFNEAFMEIDQFIFSLADIDKRILNTKLAYFSNSEYYTYIYGFLKKSFYQATLAIHYTSLVPNNFLELKEVFLKKGTCFEKKINSTLNDGSITTYTISEFWKQTKEACDEIKQIPSKFYNPFLLIFDKAYTLMIENEKITD